MIVYVPLKPTYIPLSSGFNKNQSGCLEIQILFAFPSVDPKLISSAKLLADGGGAMVSLSAGALCFVALRCYAEERAIFLGTKDKSTGPHLGLVGPS